MKYEFITTKTKTGSTEAMKQMAQKRLQTLEKFLKDDEPVRITIETFKNDKIKIKAQIVTEANKHIRAEVEDHDYYAALVDLKKALFSQIKKAKKNYTIKEHDYEEQKEEEIIKKIKTFVMLSISENQAIKEMENLGHQWYVFKNADRNNETCVIYKRFDDEYALIVTK